MTAASSARHSLRQLTRLSAASNRLSSLSATHTAAAAASSSSTIRLPSHRALTTSTNPLRNVATQAKTNTPGASTVPEGVKDGSAIVIDPMTGEATGQPNIDASATIYEINSAAPAPPPNASLVFGQSFAPHMLTIPWTAQTGWAAPRIHEYKPFVLDPSCVIFHYASTLFEGMKAYKDVNGRVRLFRPDMNMKRMNNSAAALTLPQFDGDELIKIIKQLIAIDEAWVPSAPGYSLYIRPTLIGTQAALGVAPSSEALLFVISSPVGPYYKTGFKPVALEADPNRVRAWPGGHGQYKLGANYAPGIRAQMSAATRGYQQNLWLFRNRKAGEEQEEDWLTEVGTMNMFVAIRRKEDGKTELVTPPLDGVILPGVTRDSILTLTREYAAGKPSVEMEGLPDAKDFVVTERDIHMREIIEARNEGRLLEMFGAGTAAVVSPVNRLGYLGEQIDIPVGEDGVGPITKAMLTAITKIQLGQVEHPWSVPIEQFDPAVLKKSPI
ncbi:branched-chain-amino-acid aminotransferase [Tilletia horrida]|uniref:Branched-chain-amino-acid aminotransferase n=1 Tax=Tilletia horrida TaxID=155126 RepID=A0AAN6GXX7_9BASI|nr:branched-chain-amino-acid aminotransferase [Tilletia horrida]KAK0568808.1 branched-chain-amino-acid aminotransferase [Tilletia horrida]